VRRLAEVGALDLNKTVKHYLGNDYVFGAGHDQVRLIDVLEFRGGVTYSYLPSNSMDAQLVGYFGTAAVNPGKRYSPTGAAGGVLQKVVDKVAGDYIAWCQANIFAKLGITDATDQPSTTQTQLYQNNTVAAGIDTFYIDTVGSFGWYMSLGSLAKLAAALRVPGVLSANGIKELIGGRCRLEPFHTQRWEAAYVPFGTIGSGVYNSTAAWVRFPNGYDVVAVTNTTQASDLLSTTIRDSIT
jgi:hypothetical protein